jgi:hypothetical protein
LYPILYEFKKTDVVFGLPGLPPPPPPAALPEQDGASNDDDAASWQQQPTINI